MKTKDIINEALKRQKSEYDGGNTDEVPNLDYIMQYHMKVGPKRLVKITQSEEYKKADRYSVGMELTVHGILQIGDVKKAQEEFKRFFKQPAPKV